jgi:hypothetical protein
MSGRSLQPTNPKDGKVMTSIRRPILKSRQKVAVLVLGMHRSGTSMLGGVLDRLGCQGPKSLMQANEGNPKGYFESREIMKLNDAILATLGLSWDDWRPIDPGWQESPRFDEFREGIVDTMAVEYGNASLIYLKDPRVCRLMLLWREVLVESGYTPVCIHTHRNPREVLLSLAGRKGVEVEPELGVLLWLRYVLDAEAGSRGLPRIFTSYARLLSNWTEFSDRVEDTFGFSWPVERNVRDDRMRHMIDQGLRHHNSSVEDLMHDASVPELVKDCLKVMERWARDGEDDGGRETLTRIATEFDASAALFAGSMVGLARKYKKSRGNAEKCEALGREFKEREAEIAAQHARIDALADERDRLAARDAEREAEIAARNAELHTLREERGRLEKERETLNAEITAFVDTTIGQGKTLARLNGELAALNRRQADIADTKQELSLLLDVMQRRPRPLWEKVIFRRSGKPKKVFRRILFHTSGKPRGIFRKWVLLPDGRPRAAFHMWMCSPVYQNMRSAARVKGPRDPSI